MGREVAEVEKFLEKVKKKIRVDKAILFGSRAREDHLEDSDYDVLIVSKDFEGIFFTDRPKLIYREWTGNESLELICLTPDEYEEKRRKITIIREVDRYGNNISDIVI